MEKKAASMAKEAPSTAKKAPQLDKKAPSLDKKAPPTDRKAAAMEQTALATEQKAVPMEQTAASLKRKAPSTKQLTPSLERNAAPGAPEAASPAQERCRTRHVARVGPEAAPGEFAACVPGCAWLTRAPSTPLTQVERAARRRERHRLYQATAKCLASAGCRGFRARLQPAQRGRDRVERAEDKDTILRARLGHGRCERGGDVGMSRPRGGHRAVQA